MRADTKRAIVQFAHELVGCIIAFWLVWIPIGLVLYLLAAPSWLLHVLSAVVGGLVGWRFTVWSRRQDRIGEHRAEVDS